MITNEDIQKAKERLESGKMKQDLLEGFEEEFLGDIMDAIKEIFEVVESQQSEIAELKKVLKQAREAILKHIKVYGPYSGLLEALTAIEALGGNNHE
ncbi:hypothetical protein LPY66_18270 [Dehalobacter sp. DCM]|uniref:hypothetical protein n=1 Tax=Dehalobacter sp. DCM TaxID=2907827 RepID=UPI003081338A|nr:hypothetical protein LPY66_18270 [Dehalobacter sp. DCM]